LERDLKIANASRAVDEIRAALGQTLTGAEQWLLTGPVRWAENHGPEERS
jgi:hypothetical protein